MDFNSFQKEDLWQEVLSQRTAARESRWRFVLPWCWTAQFADNRSDAAFAAGCWRAVKPCHRAHTPLCHLQHLLRLLAGDASGTITVLRLSAPGVPVSCPCNMPTCHSLLPNSFSPLLSHTHTQTWKYIMKYINLLFPPSHKYKIMLCQLNATNHRFSLNKWLVLFH